MVYVRVYAQRRVWYRQPTHVCLYACMHVCACASVCVRDKVERAFQNRSLDSIANDSKT